MIWLTTILYLGVLALWLVALVGLIRGTGDSRQGRRNVLYLTVLLAVLTVLQILMRSG
jgi:hypothetical protein